MTEQTQTQAEYTGKKMQQELEKRGFSMSPPTLKKLIDMLDSLGMVQKLPRPGMPDTNLVAPETVDKVEKYLQARRELPHAYGLPHSAHTWRMLVNLGYMK